MKKNVVAVLAGYAAWTVVFLGGAAVIRAVRASVHDAEGLTRDTLTLVFYLALSVLASLLAGLVAARIGVRRSSAPGLWLSACLLATGIPVQLSAWDKMPVWYHLAFLILLVPATLLGGRVLNHTDSAPAESVSSPV